MIHSLALLLFILAATALPSRAQTAPKPFADGDTVCFLGDSITHGGHWHRYIELYYTTHYPERKINFINCGIGGDQAGGALKRLDWDVLVHQPTVVVIMLGMNDIGHGSYEGESTPQKVAMRGQSLANYRKNMDLLVRAIKERSKASVVLVKPSPYDETAQLAKAARKGPNGALAKCGVFCEELAKEHGTSLVDFHGPMTRLMADGQKVDPKFALAGGDRVHPGPAGHLVMASLFVKAQGLEPNAKGELPIVTGVNDKVLAGILPADDLIGGSPVTEPADAKDAKQNAAKEIARLSAERFSQGLRLRDIARMEVSIRGAGVDPKDEAAVKAWMETREKALKPGTPATDAWTRMAKPYLMARASLDEILTNRQELLQKMRDVGKVGGAPE